jgi:catalase
MQSSEGLLLSARSSWSRRSFSYTGGWLSAHRLTPDSMVAALSDRGGNPLGHRRNHSKGTCFTGTFEANGAGVRLSTAPIL